MKSIYRLYKRSGEFRGIWAEIGLAAAVARVQGVWMGMMARISTVLQGSMRLLAAFCGCLMLLCSPVSAAELLDVRFGPGKGTTRIVFDVMGAPQYAVSGDDLGQGRLFVDFDSLDGPRPAKTGMGHVSAVSFTDAGRGAVRAVLSFKKTAKIKEVFLLEPSGGVAKHRLVIDLATASKADFLASLPVRNDGIAAIIEQVTTDDGTIEKKPAIPVQTASAPIQTASVNVPPAPSVKKDAIKRPAPKRKQVVVIDPGHGGRDPGALGQSGTLEKTVTFAAAKELAAILNARGSYKVVMTRGEKETIRPDKREALAREAGADLFISLHADAIAQKAVRGASVYTLSKEGTERSVKLAKSQGNYHAYDLDLKQYGQADPVLGDILLDKAQDKTMTSSSRFAELLIKNLSGKTPMLNRSHREGDLRVLLATDVPAVLLEMAFISNAKDEANLNSPVWRKRIMKAVADSIDAYFDAESRQRQARLSPAAGQ